jgi:hypothetical protein
MMAEGRVDAGIEKIAEGMLAFEAAGDQLMYDISSYGDPNVSSGASCCRWINALAWACTNEPLVTDKFFAQCVNLVHLTHGATV